MNIKRLMDSAAIEVETSARAPVNVSTHTTLDAQGPRKAS